MLIQGRHSAQSTSLELLRKRVAAVPRLDRPPALPPRSLATRRRAAPHSSHQGRRPAPQLHFPRPSSSSRRNRASTPARPQRPRLASCSASARSDAGLHSPRLGLARTQPLPLLGHVCLLLNPTSIARTDPERRGTFSTIDSLSAHAHRRRPEELCMTASLPASEQKVNRKQGVRIALCHESVQHAATEYSSVCGRYRL